MTRSTVPKATELLAKAGEILDWLDGFMPAEQRRPQLKAQTTVTVTRNLVKAD